MELVELLGVLREKLDPLEYAAVMRKYFGDGSEDWRRLQMVGIDKHIILADEDLVDYLATRGLKKFHKTIWRDDEKEVCDEYGAYRDGCGRTGTSDGAFD